VNKERVVLVKAGTLLELYERADEPIVYGNLAQIFLWTSGVFAVVSGVSLIVLSNRRRRISEIVT
jgi:hypothetical protein